MNYATGYVIGFGYPGGKHEVTAEKFSVFKYYRSLYDRWGICARYGSAAS
jgi:hypothetical protein